MRVLFLSLTLPVPPNNGHRLRNWALLRALAAEGHQTVLLTFTEPGELDGGLERLLDVCEEVRAVPLAARSLSLGSAFGARSMGLFSVLPYGVARFRCRAMEASISNCLRARRVDAVICETAYAAVNLSGQPGIPLVIDNQNVEHLLLRCYLSRERNPAKLAYAWLESRKLKSWEQGVWSRADLVAVCSAHDAGVVSALCPHRPVAVLPNVVDVDRYQETAQGELFTVQYTGGMDWFPNRDAVRFFAFEILPLLRRLCPEVKFVVAGRSPSERFRRRFLHIPNMRFTGTVPDMRAEIARASVCVVPLRIGSGTRLKILEAAAMAKPIVSTSLGAEGLEFENGKEIVLADEPEAFAQAVAGLLLDAPRCRAMGQAARRRVEQQYSYPALRTALNQALARVMQIPLRT